MVDGIEAILGPETEYDRLLRDNTEHDHEWRRALRQVREHTANRYEVAQRMGVSIESLEGLERDFTTHRVGDVADYALALGARVYHTVLTSPSPEEVDTYLGERTGTFDQHAVRYRHAVAWLVEHGLSDQDTLCDVGAGWTELDYILRAEHGWRGRYLPLDAGLFPVDLETWTPYRTVEWYVALDVIEHVHDPARLVRQMCNSATRGVVISVPNPQTTDVFGMDETHLSAPDAVMLGSLGFHTDIETFYGGHYSDGAPDAIFATQVLEQRAS